MIFEYIDFLIYRDKMYWEKFGRKNTWTNQVIYLLKKNIGKQGKENIQVFICSYDIYWLEAEIEELCEFIWAWELR